MKRDNRLAPGIVLVPQEVMATLHSSNDEARPLQGCEGLFGLAASDVGLGQQIFHVRGRSAFVAQRIEHLNRAGLDHLQISIDNVQPDEVSKKSLKVLDRKLQMLSRYAIFQVNINSVLGSPVQHPDDALTVARRALELGFTSTVGILHDHDGQLQPLGDHQQDLFVEIMQMGKRSYARFNQFQRNISQGIANGWRCRAGSRYLYICEDGLVHYCSQQRGFPAIPLEKYTPTHLVHEYHTEKSCAPHCTVSCVQQVAMLDNWRSPQTRPAFVPVENLLPFPNPLGEG